MSVRFSRRCALLLLTLLAPAGYGAETDDLPRRSFLGTKISPLPKATRESLKLEPGVGVLVDGVVPGSSAADAGLAAGDVIVAVDNKAVTEPSAFVALIAGKRAGDTLAVDLFRDGAKASKEIKLKGLPREASDAYDTVYGSVRSRAGRLRTILTRPKTPGKHPALYLIQGVGTFSIEHLPGLPPGSYEAILEDFARRGFVTFRVDKPGCGDSEGGPLHDRDFDVQLEGFRDGLKQLRSDPSVDPDNILIFGHSMGGIWAPLLAMEIPVKGIASYGTVARTWHEYMIENSRRQLLLAGLSFGDVDDRLSREETILHEIDMVGKTPTEVAEAHPELRPIVDELFKEGKYYAGIHFTFFRQLSGKNLGAAWEKFGGHALAVFGKADFVTDGVDHELIARIVNAKNPGRGRYVALENSDHGFHAAATREESFAASMSGKPGGLPLNPAIVGLLRTWSDAVVAAK